MSGLALFTLFHVLLSLAGIVAGAVALGVLGTLKSKPQPVVVAVRAA